MNPFEMVVIIVAIGTLGSIIRHRAGGRILRRGRQEWHEAAPDGAEKQRLQEEVLALKRLEIDAGRSPDTDGVDSPAGRISLADLRQRVRRLEAIAEGIDIPDARSNRGR